MKSDPNDENCKLMISSNGLKKAPAQGMLVTSRPVRRGVR